MMLVHVWLHPDIPSEHSSISVRRIMGVILKIKVIRTTAVSHVWIKSVSPVTNTHVCSMGIHTLMFTTMIS